MGDTTDTPWMGDACSLVEELRAGRRSPLEELRATYAAIDGSDLNAVSFTDRDTAEAQAREADVSLPFGGVPIAVKELEAVEGWPETEASVPLRDRVAGHTSTQVQRLRAAGAVLAAQTTASEFGAINSTSTKLHGTTHNPWQHGRTPGGSSGGSAAGVAGGLYTIATASDGGGSIRIPAGFCGLLGLKTTYGRIPRGPRVLVDTVRVTTGCVSRSVRDTARWLDVCNGHDGHEPLSLPRVEGWEAGLGTHRDELRGMRVALAPGWGGAVVSPTMWELLEAAAGDLIAVSRLRRVDVDTTLPPLGAAWASSGVLDIERQLADHWPACAGDLTYEVRVAMERQTGRYDATVWAAVEQRRMELNEAMAALFDPSGGVDLVITATNPDVAFAADGPLPKVFGGLEAGRGNNGRLTFPANIYGNPAISVPAGTMDGLPVGLQIMSRHFTEALLLDLALSIERDRPWPLTAPAH